MELLSLLFKILPVWTTVRISSKNMRILWRKGHIPFFMLSKWSLDETKTWILQSCPRCQKITSETCKLLSGWKWSERIMVWWYTPDHREVWSWASYQPTQHKPSKAPKYSPPWPLWEGTGKGPSDLNLSIFKIKVNQNNEGLYQTTTSRPLPSGMAYSSGFHIFTFPNCETLFKNEVPCRYPLL